METASLIAFVCHALAAVLSAAFGIAYLARSRFMPYHQEALGRSWEQLDQSPQALLIGLMRTAGGGLLAAGISVAALLIVPFPTGESWARYAIPVIGLAATTPALYATVFIRRRAQAHTPVAASTAGLGLIVLGAVLSFV